MEPLTERKRVTAQNGWGHDATTFNQDFLIVTADIGTTRPNYRGRGYSKYTFERSDVGRKITDYADGTGPGCWTFQRVG